MVNHISEKTLELNVSENILGIIRRNIDARAFLHGFTLMQEHTTSLDVSVKLPNNLSILGLQFKRPESQSNGIYRFEINRNIGYDQHLKLYLWSLLFFNTFHVTPLFYAFPTFFNVMDFASSSPNFLSRTYFVNPLGMPIQILDNNVHMVEIDTKSDTVNVWSESPIEIEKFYKGEKFITEIIGKKQFIQVGVLKEKLKEMKFAATTKELKNKHIEKLLESKWNIRLKGFVLF